MTHRRLNYLLLSIISFLCCLLILSVARAEDWSHTLRTGVEVSFPDTYNPGFGITGLAGLRYKFFEVRGSGDFAYQTKKTATRGWTYGAKIEARAFVYGPWYVSGAHTWAGYRSYFGADGGWADKGTTWEKHGSNWGTGGGYCSDWVEVDLLYLFREHGTPNQVESFGIISRYKAWKSLWLKITLAYVAWTQDDKRRKSFNPAIGFEWEW